MYLMYDSVPFTYYSKLIGNVKLVSVFRDAIRMSCIFRCYELLFGVTKMTMMMMMMMMMMGRCVESVSRGHHGGPSPGGRVCQ